MPPFFPTICKLHQWDRYIFDTENPPWAVRPYSEGMGRKADIKGQMAPGGKAAFDDLCTALKDGLSKTVEVMKKLDVEPSHLGVARAARAISAVHKAAKELYAEDLKADKAEKAEKEAEKDQDKDGDPMNDNDYPSAYTRPAVDTLDAWRELFERKIFGTPERARSREAVVQQPDDGGTGKGVVPLGIPERACTGPSIRRLA